MDEVAGARRRVDWGQVRTLLGAALTGTLRTRRARPVVAALSVALTLTLAALVAAASWRLGLAVRALPTADATTAVHLVYLIAFVWLALAPVVGLGGGFGGGAFLDVRRLAAFPVSPRTVFAATTCEILVAPAMALVLLPVLGATVALDGGALAIALRVVAALLLVACGAAAGQLGRLVLVHLLRSRAGRETALVLAPLLGLALVVAARSLLAGGAAAAALAAFAGWKDWTLALPSWWAASAVTARDVPALLPALALPALLWWLVVAGAQEQRRVLRSEVEDQSARPRGAAPMGLARWLPEPLASCVAKDRTLLRREPVVRRLLLQHGAFALLPALYVLWTAFDAARGEARAVDELRRLLPYVPLLGYSFLLAEVGVLLNLFGPDARGIGHLLGLPLRRRTLLLSKDLAFLGAFGLANAAATASIVLVAGLAASPEPVSVWFGRGALAGLEALCAVAAALGVGNVTSVLAPSPLGDRDRRLLAVRSGGVGGLLGSLAEAGGAALCLAAALPVAVLFHHPALGGGWLALRVPAAVLAAAGSLWLGAHVAGALLRAREEAVIARLAASPA